MISFGDFFDKMLTAHDVQYFEETYIQNWKKEFNQPIIFGNFERKKELDFIQNNVRINYTFSKSGEIKVNSIKDYSNTRDLYAIRGFLEFKRKLNLETEKLFESEYKLKLYIQETGLTDS